MATTYGKRTVELDGESFEVPTVETVDLEELRAGREERTRTLIEEWRGSAEEWGKLFGVFFAVDGVGFPWGNFDDPARGTLKALFDTGMIARRIDEMKKEMVAASRARLGLDEEKGATA